MNEKENLDVNNKPVETPPVENMDYSFDFANQVNKEEGDSAPTTEVAKAPQPEIPATPVEPLTTQTASVQTATTESVTPEVQSEPQLVDVSVPVSNENVNQETSVSEIPNNPVQTENNNQVNEAEEPIKSGKSTVIFIIILLVLVAAFIIALPFLRNLW